ncbi:MAG TPA: bifunctional sugar-1-phosphate nucleotidylyltransferase/acetyltransferase [Thermoplasmata archaeon]|jgi:bifunctional UDP-N-acetylglucosamine pyrophosphorylase/glucosamine-1-phosphate N-acetyltransferase|nr:bifunctional sugar-1-phosphate nucleotidylyltransferase/acetyltransferase [Thermoplasmata archaeon]
MKAWILAAGEGTRMRPLTANIPKPLLPVAGKPFLRHVVEALRDGGVTEVSILIGWQAKRVREYFGRGDSFGVRIDYAEQNERLGTAHAIGLAKSHVDGPFLALNGDVVLTANAIRGILDLQKRSGGPVVAVAPSPSPSEYGVIEVRDGKVVGIEEKPKAPKSNLINAGVYAFDSTIFDLIEKTRKSPRGEYEITDTLRMLIGKTDVHAFTLQDEWIDVGRPWDLLKANEILLRTLRPDIQGEVDEGAKLAGPVAIGKGTRVLLGADLRGPVVIGENCEIGPNCLIRPSTSIGNGCKVGNACEVKNSIIMDGTHVPHLNYVGDSVLGERCNLGAGTKVANLRLDERTVRITVRGKEVDTGLRKLGVVMGDDVKTGINASIDVGTVIGEETFIGMGAVVRGTIAPRSRIH